MKNKFNIQKQKDMATVTTINLNGKFAKPFICLGLVFIFGGITMLFLLGRDTFIDITIRYVLRFGYCMAIFVGIFLVRIQLRAKDYIKIHKHYLEIKLASATCINYSDFISLETTKNKEIIIHYRKGSTPENVRFSYRGIKAKELKYFLDTMKELRFNQ